MNNWYFAEQNKPSNQKADKFVDSKFTIDKWNSFTREIIQNSLDAHDNLNHPNDPVKVNFSLEEIDKNKIPGIYRLEHIIKLCVENKPNAQTENMYNNSLSILNNEKIWCLKISDFNTTGINSSLDDGWGALVYDEGVSKKQRPGSAGSHGVGKKAPFIISGCNNVFYSSLYYIDNIKQFQGKTSLVSWKENDIEYDYEGWFGSIDINAGNRRNKVVPIGNFNDLSTYDDFFYKRDDYGSDVIIVGAKIGDDFTTIKKKIIVSILENFFVGVLEKKLTVEVFGTEINNANLENVIKEYYEDDFNVENKTVNGNLEDYLDVFQRTPVKFELKYNDVIYGYIDLYFKSENKRNKKYYCVFRNHGMKIYDKKLNTDSSFTAVAVLRDYEESNLPIDKRINSIFAKRENAAHDTFVIDDDQFQCDEMTKVLITEFNKLINDFIFEKTEIKTNDEMPLEGLADMISFQGTAKKGNASKRKSEIKKRKKRVIVSKENATVGDSLEKGKKGGIGENQNITKKKGEHSPAKEGDNSLGTLFKKYVLEPTFFRVGNVYKLVFSTSVPLINGSIQIDCISIDGTVNNISNIIKKVSCNNTSIKFENNLIKNIQLPANRKITFDIEVFDLFDYTLEATIFERKETND